jgi:hypothetical protein
MADDESGDWAAPELGGTEVGPLHDLEAEEFRSLADDEISRGF